MNRSKSAKSVSLPADVPDAQVTRVIIARHSQDPSSRFSDADEPDSLAWQPRVNRPGQPAKVAQPDSQEQERNSQPQTAAFPGRSYPTQTLNGRLVTAPHDSSFQTIELETGRDRESQPYHCRWQPVREIGHGYCPSS